MEEENNPIKEVGAKTVEENANQTKGTVVAKKINTSALISLIFSLVGLVIAGIPCGLVAIITGIVGITKFNAETEKGKWMAIVGIIIGIVDVVLVITGIVLRMIALSAM